MKTKSGRGGKRVGAGAHKKGNKPVAFSIPAALIESLDAEVSARKAAGEKTTRSSVLMGRIQ